MTATAPINLVGGCEVTVAPGALSGLARSMQRQLDEERGSIARELHDDLGGLLAAVKMDVSRALQQIPDAAAEVHARLGQVQGSLDQAIDLERRIVERLQPGLLVHVGLFATLRWYVDEMAIRAAGTFRCEFPADEPPLTLPIRVSLYRILQEGLERAAASSESAIEVGAQVRAATLDLEIVHRMAPSASYPAGDDLRLLGMLQRAAGIGGRLWVGATGDLRRLVVRLPMGSQTESVG